MLRHKPIVPYSGLTIIMSNPSRFDTKALLTGTGGMFVKNECIIKHGFNYLSCDIRLKEDNSPLLPNTKAILALGASSLHKLCPEAADLNAHRGHLLHYNNVPLIASYSPQEAVDIKNYEQDNNPHLVGLDEDYVDSDKASAQDEKSHKGKTSHSNWRFWLQKDVEKVCGIVNGVKAYEQSGKDNVSSVREYTIYPPVDFLITILGSCKGQELFFDIETDSDLNITVFAFSYGIHSVVYSVPLINHNYELCYSKLDTARILRALTTAIKNNTLIAHNGAGFDFFVLAYKYKIPIGHNVYDTMLAQNRIYPEAEKSLGHSLSLPWLYLPYHKDEASFAYGNAQQAYQHWTYCAKDVSSLKLLKREQDAYAKTKVGLADSIAAVQSYVRSYLTATLTGIAFDKAVLDSKVKENDKLMEQYIRIIKLLVGKQHVDKIRGSGHSEMAGSNVQCARYFYELMGYSVAARTKENKPSVDKKALFSLKLDINNPVIDFVIAYRRFSKETGSLGFKPWMEKLECSNP